MSEREDTKICDVTRMVSEILIVYQGPWNWDYFWSRSQPLAAALAQFAHVVYVDSWGESLGTREKFSELQSRGVRKMSDRLHRCRLIDIHKLGIRQTKKFSEDDWSPRAYRMLRWQLSPLFRAFPKRWLISSQPPFHGIWDLTQWDRTIIDIEDPWLLQPKKKRTTQSIQKFIQRADVVFGNGSRIASVYGQLADRHIHNLHNGMDSAFAARVTEPQPCPEFLSFTPGRPRVVFTGQIDCRLNLTVLLRLAQRFQEVQFFFVGTERFAPAKALEWQKVRRCPNVHSIPRLAHDRIPSVLQHSDVLIIPYEDEGGSEMFPAKLFEYIGSRSVILTSVDYSTDVPELRGLRGVRACRSVEEWESALNDILLGRLLVTDEECERRARLLQANTWHAIARRLIEIVAAKPGRCLRSDSNEQADSLRL